jgi:hypothetical protein
LKRLKFPVLFVENGLFRIEHQTVGWTHEVTSRESVLLMEVNRTKVVPDGASPSSEPPALLSGNIAAWKTGEVSDPWISRPY